MLRRISSGPTTCPARRRRIRLALVSCTALTLVGGCGEDGEPTAIDAPTTDPPPATTAPATTSGDEPGDDSSRPVTDDGVRAPDGPDVPDPSTLPERDAPAGLGGVTLPGDAEDVVSLFAALPLDLFGATREIDDADPGTIAARYDTGRRQCSEIGIQAIDLGRSDGSPYPEHWRAEHLVALFATGADWDVEDAAHEGPVYWVTFETSCGGETMQEDEVVSAAVWGAEGSAWIFSVGAADADGRETLMAAFADAARSEADRGT